MVQWSFYMVSDVASRDSILCDGAVLLLNSDPCSKCNLSRDQCLSSVTSFQVMLCVRFYPAGMDWSLEVMFPAKTIYRKEEFYPSRFVI